MSIIDSGRCGPSASRLATTRGGVGLAIVLSACVVGIASWLGSASTMYKAVLIPRLMVSRAVHVWAFVYRAHDGSHRRAYVVLPAWYRARRDPLLPLVISPHGRGVSPRANVKLWGDLPAVGPFALVSPEGEGLYSWG